MIPPTRGERSIVCGRRTARCFSFLPRRRRRIFVGGGRHLTFMQVKGWEVFARGGGILYMCPRQQEGGHLEGCGLFFRAGGGKSSAPLYLRAIVCEAAPPPPPRIFLRDPNMGDKFKGGFN